MRSNKELPIPKNIIQWYEGMLLSPQHFQSHDQWIISTINLISRASNINNYGILDLSYDNSALVDGKFRILKVLAIFPDGAFLNYDIEKTNIKLEFDASEVLANSLDNTAKLYLAIPIYKHGQINVENSERYISIEEDGQYLDQNTGQNPIAIPRLQPQPCILSDNEINAQYSYIPIAIIKNSPDGKDIQKYDPPYLYVTHHSFTAELVRETIRLIKSKIAYFSQEKGLSSGIVNLDSINIINPLIQALLPLEAKLSQEKISPCVLYDALLNCASNIISINPTGILPSIPPYNHDNIFKCFQETCKHIALALEKLQQSYFTVNFHKVNNAFELKINPEWIVDNELMIGIQKNIETSEQNLLEWISGMQISSSSYIHTLKERRVLGAERKILEDFEGENSFHINGVFTVNINMLSDYISLDDPLVIFNYPEHGKTIPKDIFVYVKR